MTALNQFIDTAQMERILRIGLQEGMAQVIGQIDGILLSVASL